MMTFLSVEYTTERVLSLIFVPILSVLLILLILLLLFKRKQASGLVTAQICLGKALKLIDDNSKNQMSDKSVKKLAVLLAKANFESSGSIDSRQFDLTPLMQYLGEANDVATALKDAGRSDDRFIQLIRKNIELSRTYLQDKCGVQITKDKNIVKAHKKQRTAEANRFLDGLDKK